MMTTVRESPLEIASGRVLGTTPLAPRSLRRPAQGSALEALEAAVLPALQRPPCLVTFSGGVDSSLVLATALRVARRQGLPLPVPFSWRFPRSTTADETIRQREILAALGVHDHVAQVAGPDELDVVGQSALSVLMRHGTLHPANVHLHEAPIAMARGGSVLTGAGGDQILSGWRRPENITAARRFKDRIPAAVRVRARRLPPRELPWLHRGTAARLITGRMNEEAAEPVELGDRVRWHAGRRDLTLTLANLGALGRAHDVLVASPLCEPGFVHALAHEFGSRPAPSRSALIAAFAGQVVPPSVWVRRRKARFGAVFLAEPARALASGWDGTGVDPAVVDVAALQKQWSRWPVPLGTAGLLQQVLLARTTALTLSNVPEEGYGWPTTTAS